MAVFGGGCAWHNGPPPQAVKEVRILPSSFVDGVTTREQAAAILGASRLTFEQNRILTFRVRGDERSGFVVVQSRASDGATPHLNWGAVSHSLVLVFGPNGVLQRHSFIRVN